jgi:hypothetical protein
MTDNAFAYIHNRSLRELLAARDIEHLRTKPYRPQTNGKENRALPPDHGQRVGLRPQLPLTPPPQPSPATLARALQHAQTTQRHREPATHQPRSQPPWAGHLAAPPSTAVRPQEQHQNNEEKEQHERAHESAARDAENDQNDDEKQQQVQESPLVEMSCQPTAVGPCPESPRETPLVARLENASVCRPLVAIADEMQNQPPRRGRVPRPRRYRSHRDRPRVPARDVRVPPRSYPRPRLRAVARRSHDDGPLPPSRRLRPVLALHAQILRR